MEPASAAAVWTVWSQLLLPQCGHAVLQFIEGNRVVVGEGLTSCREGDIVAGVLSTDVGSSPCHAESAKQSSQGNSLVRALRSGRFHFIQRWDCVF